MQPTEKNYEKTQVACFVGYIVQAIVNNFVPLLFLTFQSQYGIPLSQITLLVTLNFGLQLLVDLASVKFVDKIGYRASAVLAHAMAIAGFVLLTILPLCGAADLHHGLCRGRRSAGSHHQPHCGGVPHA